jgi:L-arabinose isomerase
MCDIYTQISQLKQQNEEIVRTLNEQNILFDNILVEPNLLSSDEILRQITAINAYLKWVVIQNSINDIVR